MPRRKMLSNFPGKARDFLNDELSYNLQRPYPFHKRFKTCVSIGIILFLAVFTVFNVATTGFDMQPKYTTNPNGTEDHKQWFNNVFFTWNDDTLNPQCQHFDIPVGYDFMTTNLGLRYTVTGVSSQSDSSNPKAKLTQRSSLSYHNNSLTDCEVSTIDIDLRKSDDTANCDKCWWSWMDSSADATTHCKIVLDEGPFIISFKTHYTNLATLYNDVTIDNSIPSSPYSYLIKRAGMTFIPVEGKSIKDPGLFTLRYFTLTSTGTATNLVYPNPSDLYNNKTLSESRPLTEALFFAKSRFATEYTLILADLGNNYIENYILDLPNNSNRQPGAPLRNSSTLDCKSTITLTVLVANFALFQTGWMIFKWLADQFVKGKDQRAMYCEGCIELSKGLATMEPEEADLSTPKRLKRESNWSISSTQGLLEDHTNGADSFIG
ncbi:hypothetical protein V2W45_1472349 [Cenococcum geophilum]